MDFKGKNIIVTGGASGIGRAVVDGIVEGGGHAIVVDINMEMAMKVVEELGSENVSAYRVDLSDSEAIRTEYAKILEEKGQIHGLINNAGIVSTAPFEEITQAEWDRVMAINLTGNFAGISALIPSMRANGYGKIVNVASVAAKLGGGLLGTAAYASSKAGVIGLTRAVARETAADGITCNCVCPSYTVTPMTSNIPEEKRLQMVNAIPMKRGGTPKEIANVILFYASDLTSFVTGEISDVDGGITRD